MTKKILILCQRKSSTLPSNSKKVDETIEIINTFIERKFREDVIIEYLTTHDSHPDNNMDETNYDADYKFALNNNREALDFVAKHEEFYDGIILNTCPKNYMNYEMINKLLKVGGFILLKTFAPDDEDGEIGLQTINLLGSTLKTLNNYFKHIINDDYGSHYYIKEHEKAGKKTRRKIKRKKIKRRKIKRTTKKRSSHYD